jgi:hypothetical protein
VARRRRAEADRPAARARPQDRAPCARPFGATKQVPSSRGVSDYTAGSVLGSANESGVERRRSGLLAGAVCRSDAASTWPSLRGLRRGRRGGLALPRGLPGMALHLAAFRSGFLVACVARLLRGSCLLAPLLVHELPAGVRQQRGPRGWLGTRGVQEDRGQVRLHACDPRQRLVPALHPQPGQPHPRRRLLPRHPPARGPPPHSATGADARKPHPSRVHRESRTSSRMIGRTREVGQRRRRRTRPLTSPSGFAPGCRSPWPSIPTNENDELGSGMVGVLSVSRGLQKTTV